MGGSRRVQHRVALSASPGLAARSPVLRDARVGVSGCGRRPLPEPHPLLCARETQPVPKERVQAPLAFPCRRPRRIRTGSKGGSVPPGRLAGCATGLPGAGGHLDAVGKVGAPGPGGARPHPARPAGRPSPRRASDTPAAAAPPPSSARLPFKREAQLDLCRPRRGAPPFYGGVGSSGSDSRDGLASRAGGQASGREPPSPQRSRGERARGGGGGVGGPGRAGGGERGEAGSRAAGARVRL